MNELNTEELIQAWSRVTVPWCDETFLAAWKRTFLDEVVTVLRAFPAATVFLRSQAVSSAVFIGNHRCHKPMNDFIYHVVRWAQSQFEQRRVLLDSAVLNSDRSDFESVVRGRQVRLIDMAYSSVTTPYIFHLEDDYEFYRPGFMQPSRDMLNSNPAILQILLRGWEECQPRFSYVAPDESHGIINTEDPIWHGFSWNPGLRRLAEYKLIGNFARLAPTQKILPMIPAVALPYEAEAGLFYYHHGYYVVILDREGYVRTTGITRHVSHPDDYQSIPDDIPGLAPCPCGSGERFMLCHGKLRFPQP